VSHKPCTRKLPIIQTTKTATVEIRNFLSK
jgi:hypothetical protein